jgi:hypothetical protein
MKRMSLLAIPVLLGAYSVMSTTTPPPPIEYVQEEAVDDSEPALVSDHELQVFINVYSSMQLDHSLTVEEAVQKHDVTVEEFRDIERRVQDKPRLVAKVREALIEQAKQRSAFTEPRSQGAEKTPEPKKD